MDDQLIDDLFGKGPGDPDAFGYPDRDMFISEEGWAVVERLQAHADNILTEVDWETLTVVNKSMPKKEWPEGDRTPNDYEGGKDERR